MKDRLLRAAVHLMFMVTSRRRVSAQVRRSLADYLKMAEALSPADGSRCVRVPSLPGVDADMRDWSFFMILEHNRLVNRSISAIVQQLARGEPLSGPAIINPKTDVLPSPASGSEQVALFADSVEDHLKGLKDLGNLRGTRTAPHPIFGDFDAHRWHCMFAFHLKIHVGQAHHVVQSLAGD